MTNTFEKQRDLLLQEITSGIDTVVYNLDILNQSLNDSIQVGKEFESVGRLWSTFYNESVNGTHPDTRDSGSTENIKTSVGSPAGTNREGEEAI